MPFAIEEYFSEKIEKMLNKQISVNDKEFEKVMLDDYLRSGTIGIERIMFLNNMIKRFLEEIVPPYFKIALAVCDKDNYWKPSKWAY